MGLYKQYGWIEKLQNFKCFKAYLVLTAHTDVVDSNMADTDRFGLQTR